VDKSAAARNAVQKASASLANAQAQAKINQTQPHSQQQHGQPHNSDATWQHIHNAQQAMQDAARAVDDYTSN